MHEETAAPRVPEHATRWAPIRKPAMPGQSAPDLADYERVRAEFSWDGARSWVDGLPNGRGLNIGHEAVDRHAGGASGSRLALRWISRNGARRDFTYDALRDATNRFANVLGGLGIGSGDVVATGRARSGLP